MDPYIEHIERKQYKHLYVDSSGRVPIDHVDGIKKATDFVGSWLVAKKLINIYSSPGGAVIGTRNPGQTVGRIYSYVDKYGNLWWQLEGTGGGNGGFVKHETGAFDQNIAVGTSSQTEHEKNVQEMWDKVNEPDLVDKVGSGLSNVVGGVGDVAKGLGNTLTNFGQYLPIIIGALALFVIVTALLKAKTL